MADLEVEGLSDSFVGLPDTRGRSSPPQPPALGSTNRSSALGYSHLVGILFLGTAADCYSSQWSRRPDLRRGGDSRLSRGLTGCRSSATAGTTGCGLTPRRAFGSQQRCRLR